MRVHDIYGVDGEEGGEVGTFDANSNSYGVTLQHRSNEHDQENILNYFDAALHKNWAGPEHWKIARVKEAAKAAAQSGEKKTRKEKEPFEIDFLSPMTEDLAGLLYTNATSTAQICLPKKDRRSRTRNLLPDDKHFHSKDLLKLFLKPKASMGARKATGRQLAPVAEGEEVDEAYWANANARQNNDDDVVQGDYDANFFQDDNLPLPGGIDPDDDDGLEFADAREHLSPGIADEVDAAGGPEGPGIDGVVAGEANGGDFGANLVAQSRRLRPEYVQYARVAKKVDVRRLKQEMWRGIGFEEVVSAIRFLRFLIWMSRSRFGLWSVGLKHSLFRQQGLLLLASESSTQTCPLIPFHGASA
jgi:condensin complex subunit 2